ncbi:hypothetical protein JXR93_10525 [bacterium]|nr:hypothetical protein [bacterium]
MIKILYGFAIGFFMSITSLLFSILIENFYMDITKELIIKNLENPNGAGGFIGLMIIIFLVKKFYNYDIRKDKYIIFILLIPAIIGAVTFARILKMLLT